MPETTSLGSGALGPGLSGMIDSLGESWSA